MKIRMIWFIELIFIIVLFILLFFVCEIKEEKSNYWKDQPVIRDKFNWNGYLFNQLPEFEIILPKNKKYNFSYDLDSKTITKWISSNFSEYNWTGINPLLDSNYENSLNISLVDNNTNYIGKNKIIGFIHVRFIDWFFSSNSKSGEIYKLGFVDYLCIDKNRRNLNLAAIMISEMMRVCKLKNYCLGFIFKIDKKELSFPYWYKSNYFIKELDSITPNQNIEDKKEDNKEKININELTKILSKENLGKQFSIFPLLNSNQINQYLDNLDNKIYKVYMINNKIVCLGREGKLYENDIFDIDQVIYNYLDYPDINNHSGDLWKEMETLLSSKYKYISQVNNQNNLSILDGWIKGNNLYFYFYNFSYQQLDESKTWINFN